MELIIKEEATMELVTKEEATMELITKVLIRHPRSDIRSSLFLLLSLVI